MAQPPQYTPARAGITEKSDNVLWQSTSDGRWEAIGSAPTGGDDFPKTVEEATQPTKSEVKNAQKEAGKQLRKEEPNKLFTAKERDNRATKILQSTYGQVAEFVKPKPQTREEEFQEAEKYPTKTEVTAGGSSTYGPNNVAVERTTKYSGGFSSEEGPGSAEYSLTETRFQEKRTSATEAEKFLGGVRESIINFGEPAKGDFVESKPTNYAFEVIGKGEKVKNALGFEAVKYGAAGLVTGGPAFGYSIGSGKFFKPTKEDIEATRQEFYAHPVGFFAETAGGAYVTGKIISSGTSRLPKPTILSLGEERYTKIPKITFAGQSVNYVSKGVYEINYGSRLPGILKPKTEIIKTESLFFAPEKVTGQLKGPYPGFTITQKINPPTRKTFLNFGLGKGKVVQKPPDLGLAYSEAFVRKGVLEVKLGGITKTTPGIIGKAKTVTQPLEGGRMRKSKELLGFTYKKDNEVGARWLEIDKTDLSAQGLGKTVKSESIFFSAADKKGAGSAISAQRIGMKQSRFDLFPKAKDTMRTVKGRFGLSKAVKFERYGVGLVRFSKAVKPEKIKMYLPREKPSRFDFGPLEPFKEATPPKTKSFGGRQAERLDVAGLGGIYGKSAAGSIIQEEPIFISSKAGGVAFGNRAGTNIGFSSNLGPSFSQIFDSKSESKTRQSQKQGQSLKADLKNFVFSGGKSDVSSGLNIRPISLVGSGVRQDSEVSFRQMFSTKTRQSSRLGIGSQTILGTRTPETPGIPFFRPVSSNPIFPTRRTKSSKSRSKKRGDFFPVADPYAAETTALYKVSQGYFPTFRNPPNTPRVRESFLRERRTSGAFFRFPTGEQLSGRVKPRRMLP